MTFIFLDHNVSFTGIPDTNRHAFTHIGNGVIVFKGSSSTAVYYRSSTDSITWTDTQYGGNVTSGYNDAFIDGSNATMWKIVTASGNDRTLRVISSGIQTSPSWPDAADDIAGDHDIEGTIEDMGVGASIDHYQSSTAFGIKKIGDDEIFQWVTSNVNAGIAQIDVIADDTDYPGMSPPRVIKGDAGKWHVFFSSTSGPSRTNLTVWHAIVEGSQGSFSVDINPVHSSDEAVDGNDWSLPIRADNGDIHIALTINPSGTNRLYLGTWTRSSETWSTEEVSSTWSTFSTPQHSVGVDRGGVVYILAIGEDPDTENNSRMHVYSRQTPASSWVHQEITDVTFSGGSSSIGISVGAGNLYPETGTLFFIRNSAISDWLLIYLDGLVFTQNERMPTCDAEPSRTTIDFDDEGTSEATLSLKPDIVFAEELRYQVMERVYERGYKNTHPLQDSARTRYVVRWNNRSTTDKDTLETFFDARRGQVDAWSLALPPDYGTTKKLALDHNTVNITKLAPDVWNIEIIAVELLT